MKITKKAISAILALVLALGLSAPASAFGATKSDEHQTIATGGSTMAFIDTNGDLYMCGNNYWGQLGDGTTKNTTTPKKIMSKVVGVSCGYNFTAAVTKSGELYLWGDNSQGQLGTGNKNGAIEPVKVLDNVQTVSCSPDSDHCFVAAVKTNGTLWTWGDNSSGQLATGNEKSVLTPTKVLSKVSAVNCGGEHIAIIKTDKTLWACGSNAAGQLGNGSRAMSVSEPVKVMDNVTTVSCGIDYTAAIKTNDALWTWGNNNFAQLGTGTYDNASKPTKVLTNVFSVSCGDTHTVAVTNNGELYVWGSKNNGQLGFKLDRASNECLTTPTKLTNGIVLAYSGLWYTVAVDQSGNLYTCGYAGNDSLGYSGGDLAYTSGNKTYQFQTTLKLVKGYSLKLPKDHPTTTGPVEPPRPPKPDPDPDPGYVSNFTDVPSNAYYAKAVQWAVKNNITSGTSKTTFSPDNECSLAEMVTMLWRANGRPSSNTSCPFSIQPSSPYYTALCWAEEKAVLDRVGISTGTIVTRKMMIQYLWRANGCPPVNHLVSFDDVPRTADYITALTWAVDCGIASGYGNGKFSPDSVCTRAQVVTFLYNTYR